MADSKPAALQAAGPVLAAEVGSRARPNVKLIGLLALGHLVIDVNGGALSALLPFLKDAHGLSYAQAATIVLVSTLTSSIIQPLFGYLSDQTGRRWLLPVSIALAGLGFGLTGVAPSYAAILALVVLSGIGTAAFHPEGYKTATGVAGPKKATAIGWFSLGGNVGFALGPPVMTVLVMSLGVAGTLGLLAPTLVTAALFAMMLPLIARTSAAPRPAVASARAGVNMPRAMALLMLVVTLRSWSTLGFTTFVPFFYIDVLKQDPRLIGPLLFVFLGSGALGSVFGGPIADRLGARAFTRWVLLAALPFGVLFMLTDGIVRFVMLGIFGAILTASFSVSVVLAQAYLPKNAGMASGLIVGFAVGTGGLAVTLLGVVADHYGVATALWISALMPLAGFAAARTLPAPRAFAQ
ncbi:MAG: MFS transporter [Candidatus Rokubacteria bacterium]|nr:MFS transporter [Candidatus Rokubacteria bacterium]